MVTEVFVMCDGANDSHGKLNILGAFDTIAASEFPFAHPHCTIALRLRYTITDRRESKIRLVIQEVTGEPVLANLEAAIQQGDSPNPTSTANLIVNLTSIRFEKPGDYSVILYVDEKPTAMLPIYIRSTNDRGNAH